jgi:hypothetical protein
MKKIQMGRLCNKHGGKNYIFKSVVEKPKKIAMG